VESEFSAILGHDFQLSELSRDLASGNVAHAYLFSGPPHIGKFTVAKSFAKKLLLDGEDPALVPAKTNQVDRLLHPDLFVLDRLWIEDTQEDFEVLGRFTNIPQQHRQKSGAKTDTISIDDVRVLQERLYEVSTARYRCCLIRSFERMREEASNAFLKILEEPPKQVVFILTAATIAALPPTIVSRVRVLQFFPLSLPQLRPLVSSLEEGTAAFLLHVCQGAPGIIRRLIDDPEMLREQRSLHVAAGNFWHTTVPAQRLKVLRPLADDPQTLDRFVLHLCLTLREQLPESAPAHIEALQRLLRGLQTNVHKGLLLQQFALAV
jgi:DNA polymerase-3 subunit delta'